MKSDFVSTVSLELRAPLTSIYGFAQTLLREDVAFGEAERRTFLEFIARESKRLTTIVDALLERRAARHGRPGRVARADRRRRRRRRTSSTRRGSTANGHRFVAEVEPRAVAAQADPTSSGRCSTSSSRTPSSTRPTAASSRVSAQRRRRTRSRSPSPTRASGSRRPSANGSSRSSTRQAAAQGTGLGLFIAQGLVREMGGRIRVDSEEGRGSRFAFELPAARGDGVTFAVKRDNEPE